VSCTDWGAGDGRDVFCSEAGLLTASRRGSVSGLLPLLWLPPAPLPNRRIATSPSRGHCVLIADIRRSISGPVEQPSRLKAACKRDDGRGTSGAPREKPQGSRTRPALQGEGAGLRSEHGTGEGQQENSAVVKSHSWEHRRGEKFGAPGN
jgi:hypothetical protein